jgi:acyl-coenzyme A thioesterase PaaI-like protein
MLAERAERVIELETVFANAPVAKLCGCTMKYNEQLTPVFTIKKNENLNHGYGAVHGGIIAFLLDSAGILSFIH